MTSAPAPDKTLILGIGNLLMGDEGIGIHVVRALDPATLPAGVELLDGGTGGFHLLDLFRRYRRILLVDATLDGQPPGTLTILRPRFSRDYPPTLTAHDIGLKDLLDAAQLLEYRPEIVLFALSIPPVAGPILGLSEPLSRVVPQVVRAILDQLGSSVTPP